MKTRYRILIVDDEDNVRRMLATAFSLQGHETHCASNGRTALEHFADTPPDVVLMDIRMPEMNGIDTLKVMRAQQPRIPIILMTAYAEVETAVEALRSGAFDYVIKPFDLDELNLLIQRAMQMQAMKQEICSLHQALSTCWQWGHILTNSPRMMDICKDTAKIALSQANVLISGESGTGKELIARAIHYNSRRANGPFIKINCAALPESLLESELFGHEKGAFREDLFYRLNVIHLMLPPLRERREDIALLANHFLQKFSAENQRDIIEIDPAAMSLLNAWPWPGNIRELSNVIERAVVMNTGAVIFAEDLPAPFRQSLSHATEVKPTQPGERNLKEEIKREERRIIMEVLEQQEGNRTRSALMPGISRRALMYKLQEYGIDPAGL